MKPVDDMTIEQLRNALTWWREMGLNVWAQYAHYTDTEGRDRYSHNCLSVLEELEEALLYLDLISKNGTPQWPVSSQIDAGKR